MAAMMPILIVGFSTEAGLAVAVCCGLAPLSRPHPPASRVTAAATATIAAGRRELGECVPRRRAISVALLGEDDITRVTANGSAMRTGRSNTRPRDSVKK